MFSSGCYLKIISNYKLIELSKNFKRKMSTKNTQSSCRHLAAFDFDYTIVAKNTDTVIRDLLPISKRPELNETGWTEYMANVFRLLHQQQVTPAKICDTIRCIPEVPGFVRLLKRLHQCYNFEIIIISDSNSVFISEWLQAHGIANCIAKVFTNPAKFEENGLLTIRPYHQQMDCKLSSENLCKGKVLEHYIIEQDLRRNLRFQSVVYVGDGHNDICPVLRLQSNKDIACARRGYPLDKNLEKNNDKLKVKAKILIWNDGFNLLEQLEGIGIVNNQQKQKNGEANEN